MQGLNLTPLHGHTALFGVYGMLGIGLMLFALRALFPQHAWRDRPLRIAFWCTNGGLALMALLSLLPVGVLQTNAAIQHGLWYARSAEFLQSPLITALKWWRVPGDVLFGIGIIALAWFVVGLKTGWSFRGRKSVDVAEPVLPLPDMAP
jgi:nitric oxide reductase subunit B